MYKTRDTREGEIPGGSNSSSEEFFFFAGAPWIAGQEQAEVNISFVSPCEPSTTLVKVSQLKNAQKLNSQSSNQTGVNYIVQ